MENLIQTIQAATKTDASDEARAAGAQACRTLLAALEAKEGQPLVAPQAPMDPADAALQLSVPDPPSAAATAQMIASALRGMKPDQLLDLAIARLKAALPAGSELPSPQSVKFHIIPINR